MRLTALASLLLLASPGLCQPAAAQPDGTDVTAAYDIYAHGFRIAEMQADYSLGPGGYRVQVAYRTTGLAGVLFGGHQLSAADGDWNATGAAPRRFAGEGEWRGGKRATLIEYERGQPVIRTLSPPADGELIPCLLRSS